jgi:hypothetical protein
MTKKALLKNDMRRTRQTFQYRGRTTVHRNFTSAAWTRKIDGRGPTVWARKFSSMTVVLLFWEEGIKETAYLYPPLPPNTSKSSSEVFVKQLTCGYLEYGMNVVMILMCMLQLGFTLKFNSGSKVLIFHLFTPRVTVVRNCAYNTL